MDMKIKASLVRQLRQERVWSQQHLADSSGISLRTIQRIETTGQASPESVKALAAVFSMDANQLIQVVAFFPGKTNGRKLIIGIPALLASILSITFLATASAEPVMLGVSFSTGDRHLADVQLLTDTGKPAEVILDNGLKVSFIPTITPEGQMRIEAKLFKPEEGGSYSLLSSPTVITEYRKSAGVKYEGDDGTVLSFDVTPQ